MTWPNRRHVLLQVCDWGIEELDERRSKHRVLMLMLILWLMLN